MGGAVEGDMPVIRRLGPDDAADYREFRLATLAGSPTAFGSSYEEDAVRPLQHFRDRIGGDGPDAIFAAFAAGRIVGTAGFYRQPGLKKQHIGVLWGVAVDPAWRGRGLGARLVDTVIAHARQHVIALRALVVTTNASARGIYDRAGFRAYGVETQVLCVDGVYYDEDMLTLDFAPPLSP